MAGGPAARDPLSEWLQGEGPAILDAVAREAPDVIGVLDRELNFRYVNRTGPSVTRESLLGRSVLELTPPESRELARESYAQVLQTGAGAQFEIMYQDAHGVRQWEVRIGPIRSDGQIIGLIGITS